MMIPSATCLYDALEVEVASPIKKTRSHGTIAKRVGLGKRPISARDLPFSSSRVGCQKPVRNVAVGTCVSSHAPRSRVGSRRGSGFDDADVSSIPPIIPYGGFSPIRLQG